VLDIILAFAAGMLTIAACCERIYRSKASYRFLCRIAKLSQIEEKGEPG
jgi:hypothetical protein